MKHELLVIFITSRADKLNDSILSVVTERNETEKPYCIIHIFLIVAHSSEKTNKTIALRTQLGSHHAVRMCACVCVYARVSVRVLVCEINRISEKERRSNQRKLAPSKG